MRPDSLQPDQKDKSRVFAKDGSVLPAEDTGFRFIPKKETDDAEKTEE